jgi:hypothetical protein
LEASRVDWGKRALGIGRSVAAVAVGYVLFVLGAWVAQEAILGGVSFHDPLGKLMLAAVLTPVSAVLGGFVTAALAGKRPLLHVTPMCLLITLETTVLYSSGKVDGPLWFEAGAGASLILGAILGAWAWLRLRRSSTPSQASS